MPVLLHVFMWLPELAKQLMHPPLLMLPTICICLMYAHLHRDPHLFSHPWLADVPLGQPGLVKS